MGFWVWVLIYLGYWVWVLIYLGFWVWVLIYLGFWVWVGVDLSIWVSGCRSIWVPTWTSWYVARRSSSRAATMEKADRSSGDERGCWDRR